LYISILRYSKAIIIALVLGFSFQVAVYGEQTEVIIGTERGYIGSGKIIIAISQFSPMTEADGKTLEHKYLTDILKNDLYLTGMFSIQESLPAKEKDDINFAQLLTDGINYAAIATYTIRKDELSVIGVLYNVDGMFMVFKKKYEGSEANHRALVHQFAEDIMKNLTGSNGITGSKIAFVSDFSGNKEVYVADYDGYNIRQITREKSLALLPRWSPDKGRIIYTSYKDRKPYLYVLDSKGGPSKRLFVSSYSNIGGSWSPKGRFAALTMTVNGNSDVYVYDEKNNKLKNLTNSWAIDTSASWMGDEILFTSDRSGNPQVYVMDTEGTNLRRLTFEAKYNDSAVWSARANLIVFVSLEDSGFNIFTIRADGSDRKRLTYNDGSNENPSWSPDGNQIIFTSNRSGKKRIYVMRADGEYERPLFSLNGNCETPSWSQ